MPILIALETEWRTMLRAMLLCLPAGVAFYTLFVFVVSYLQAFVHVPEREALEVNTISMIGLWGGPCWAARCPIGSGANPSQSRPWPGC